MCFWDYILFFTRSFNEFGSKLESNTSLCFRILTLLSNSDLFVDCFAFIDAIEVIEVWLDFLANELCSGAIVLRLFVRSYFNILVLDDLLLLWAAFSCSFISRFNTFLTFYCKLIKPILRSASNSNIPAIKVLSYTEYTILDTRWIRLS
jgi:hypothetical protein